MGSLVLGITKEESKTLTSLFFVFVLKTALQFRSTMISTDLVLSPAAQMPASFNFAPGTVQKAAWTHCLSVF